MSRKLTISIWLTLLICLSTTITVQTQTKREVLTNSKIIELVKLGLDEEIIVEKIRQSECQCDTSTAGLTKLKAAKVSKTIIMAMLNPASSGYSESQPTLKTAVKEDEDLPLPTKSTTPNKTSNAVLNQMREPGIYLFEDGKATAIEPTIYSGTKTSVFSSVITYGIKKAKVRAVVRGKSANMQVKSARPEFYFIFSREYGNAGAVMAGGFHGYAATSPAEFMMISMDVKKNSREAVLGEFGITGASTGSPDKYIREYAFEKIKPGVYKVVPKVDLAPGEYCIYFAGAGGAASKVFDFSIK